MNTLYSPQFSRTWLGGNVYVPVYCERTLFFKWPAQATTAILTAGSELRTLQLLQRTTWPQNPKNAQGAATRFEISKSSAGMTRRE